MILTSNAYDPDAPEGAKPRGSDYISIKDVRWIALIVIVLAVLGYPIYDHMRLDSQKTICRRNLGAISKAISSYAEIFDGRYPPLYAEGDNQSPYLENGKPVTWASVVSPYMPKSYGSFTCPSGTTDEGTPIDVQKDGATIAVLLSYGMYVPLATRPVQEVARPEGTILVAETSNHGARDTYSPVDFQNSKSQVVPFNGFLIGWNNSNFEWNAESKRVTHLAFYDTGNGVFDDAKTKGRHGDFIYSLFADGHYGHLTPSMTAVANDSGNKLEGLWASK